MDILKSGGARGADATWGEAAAYAGHRIIHYTFAGHRIGVPMQTRCVLTASQLALANPALRQANFRLRRRVDFESDAEWINLLRRNYYQILDTERLYAVTTLHSGPDWRIEGGTAWAVAMFLDRYPDGEAYVFDQPSARWYSWRDGEWHLIDAPPTPHGVWTGIGTRDLFPVGGAAIRALWA